MKISITKKDYRALLEVLFVADWFVDANNVGTYNKRHESVRKNLLSHYKDMGAEDVIEFDEVLDNYYPTREFDQHLHDQYIDTYNEITFWHELIDKLAERDVVNSIGIEKYRKLDGLDRVNLVEDQKEKYAAEFNKHGLDRVRIEGMGSN